MPVKMKGYIVLFLTMFPILAAQAQYNDFVLGFKAGAAYSGISNLENMIVPEDYFETDAYSFVTHDNYGAVAGAFIHFRVLETFLSVQPEVTYSTQGATLSYHDNMDYAYDIRFKYQYVNVALFFKTDYKGVSLRAGPRLGFAVNPAAVKFSSNNRAYGEDNDIEQGFKNVLKGRTDFNIGAGLAYESKFGFGLEAMYFFGVGDVIETLTNSYDFIENTNRSRSIQLTLTYTLDLRGDGKKR
ncbi:hypothetical protein FACS189430_12520 [Bacteroidia bacterium]|nr:hypothetical protein FACS189430_12520 [Bacteroidia bacterium]